MPTTGIVNGTAFGVYLGNSSDLIGFATSCSCSVTHSPRNTTTSISGGYTSRMAGTLDWEVGCESFVSMLNVDDTAFHELFIGYLDTRTTLLVKFKTTTSGDQYFRGYAIMTSLSMEAPNEQSTTMSVTFAAAGPLEVYTV